MIVGKQNFVKQGGTHWYRLHWMYFKGQEMHKSTRKYIIYGNLCCFYLKTQLVATIILQ